MRVCVTTFRYSYLLLCTENVGVDKVGVKVAFMTYLTKCRQHSSAALWGASMYMYVYIYT